MYEDTTVQATKFHEICAGHRVIGQGGKCERSYHGHNYVIHFTVEGEVKEDGMVMDFGIIGNLLCNWIEENYDHKTLIWEKDPHRRFFEKATPDGVCIVPFNPTAENIGAHLLNVVGPEQLQGTGAKLVRVKVEETTKCSAVVKLRS